VLSNAFLISSTRNMSAAGNMSSNRKFKVVLWGDPGSGKTCWIKKLLTGEFEKKYHPTVGCDIFNYVHKRQNADDIEIAFWDTSGKERKGVLNGGYFSGADLIVCVGDDFKAVEEEYIQACLQLDMIAESGIQRIYFGHQAIPDDAIDWVVNLVES